MNATNLYLDRTSDRNLALAIEPLASYICAAIEPREALRSALAVLLDEVNETNKAALRHFSRLSANSLELAS